MWGRACGSGFSAGPREVRTRPRGDRAWGPLACSRLRAPQCLAPPPGGAPASL